VTPVPRWALPELTLNTDLKWPPKRSEPYPDFIYRDQTGKLVPLSSLKGKVILLALVDMASPSCQGFAGANRFGPFGIKSVEPGLKPIHEYFATFARGVHFPDDRLAYAQLLCVPGMTGVLEVKVLHQSDRGEG
jgi:hypothetical protein